MTLIEAYRMCECDGVYLHPLKSSNIDVEYLSDKKIRDRLDMKAIRVLKIRPKFSFYGEFLGMEFDVSGVSAETLRHIAWR